MTELEQEYTAGFVTAVESELTGRGLNEATVRLISAKNNEPEWLLEFRLTALSKLDKMKEPSWAELKYTRPDYDNIFYHSRPKKQFNSIDEVPQEILDDFERLGIPLHERAKLAGVAVDAVYDSVSIGTTYKEKLAEQGIIFCSFSEAVKNHPDLVRHYLGTIIPQGDNWFACINSAVFSDGSFVYIPPGTRCPLELSTYFRINSAGSGQFERTLIIADKDSYVSYLEGCTAPQRDENQLHAAVVELVALDRAEIKYSTVQNWYPGDENGVGGIYNFVTKRGRCQGEDSKISWTQVETGSAITWKYPSCVLYGTRSRGEFYSVAVTRNHQQADTGTKMIHIGRDTRSRIVSKGISLGHSSNTYRGLVRMTPTAKGARNFTQCDSLMIGNSSHSNTVPYTEVMNNSAQVEHEATTGRVSDDELYYLATRGLDPESAASAIVNGFCRSVLNTLPLEFAAEANKLLAVTMEGSIG
jgi:Fe-S cluster assembly protein SufB